MSSLQGTRALLASRRPGRAFFLTGVAAGATLGLGSTLVGAGHGDVAAMQLLAAAIAGAAGAIHAGGNLTLGLGGLAAPSRREELSLLPIGRLALPAAIYLGTAGTTLAGWSAWSLPFLLTSAPCHGERTLLVGLASLAAALVVSLGLAAPIALASRTSGLLLSLYAFGPALAVSLHGMGHGEVATALFGLLTCAALGVLCLVLPFVVHGLGPAAIQTAKGVPTRDGTEEGLAVTLSGAVATAFLAGSSVALVVLAGGLAAWNLRRLRQLPRPARRRWRASPVAIGLMVALLGPIAASAMALDVWTQARADAGAGLVARIWSDACVVDPTGRRAAVLVDAPSVAGFTARRVVVVELLGPAAGRCTVVPARFPTLEPGAWSADGRWLAVQDDSSGRFERPAFGGGLGLPEGQAGVVMVGLFGWLRGTTFVVDGESGEVRDVGRRVVAPGWRAPDELVEVVFGLDGRLRLRKGDEAQLFSRYWRPRGYLDGRLVVERPGSEPRHDRRLGEVSGDLLRWTAGGDLEPLPLAPAGWEARDDEVAGSVTVARGDAPGVTLEDAAVVTASIGEGSLLALAEAGLVRIGLPAGDRTLLVPGARKLLPLGGRPRAFAAHTATEWFLVEGEGAPRGLTLPAGSVPCALAADGRVVTVGAAPALVDADGRATPLIR